MKRETRRRIPTYEIRMKNICIHVIHVWASNPEDQKLWFSVAVSRLEKSGRSWTATQTLQDGDIPCAVKAVGEAFDKWRKELHERRSQVEETETSTARAG